MRKHVLLTVLVLSIISIICSCKKNNDDKDKYGNVTFWTSEKSSQITVSFKGVDKTITKYYPNYDPNCGDSGCANYTNIPTGTYSYSAENYWGTYSWNGTVTVTDGSCSLILLGFNKELTTKIVDKEHMLINANDNETVE